MPLTTMAFILLIACATVTAALWLVLRMSRQPTNVVTHSDIDSRTTLLFEGCELVDATDTAHRILGLDPEKADWSSIKQELVHRFSGLPNDLDDLDEGVHTLGPRTNNDPSFLEVERAGASSIVTLYSDGAKGDAGRLAQLEAENATLRRAVESSPHPIWQAEATGQVSWYNRAYGALLDKAGKQASGTEPLFDIPPDLTQEPRDQRAQLQRQSDGTHMWFDLVLQRMDGVAIGHAMDIEPVIRAEVAQRNFVQTLAKTFAQLSIGLAIFDRNGKLALFNPALVDLTTLPAELLSGRPDLATFFDQLRDRRMMPEPKSYISWRQEIAEMIAAAEDGRYQETWTLESGQTYRVSGRPHPDNAIAFLIEDISAEMLLTRNFRAELELGQSLVDSLTDPIAVFTNTGVLTLSNAAYRSLCKVDPHSSFADFTVLDALRDWHQIAQPSPVWGDIRDFVQDMGERVAWDAAVSLKDGSRWVCHVQPIATGATAVRLSPDHAHVKADATTA
ncbi:MAG: PAS-domain containing protein [Pseudomonadota bacterium]